MKILLISPIDPRYPKLSDLKYLFGGENTYTHQLLSNPPKKVQYIHFHKALKQGSVVYTGYQKFFSWCMTGRLLPPDAGVLGLKINGNFDLIHCHGYCLKLTDYNGPVILSDSSSNYFFIRDYLGWSRKRIKLSYKIRKLLAEKFSFYDPNLHLYKAKKLIVWSEFAKKIHIQLGADPQKIIVIPPGIQKLKARKIKHKTFNIAFVGIWFARKGGDLLLEAYQKLKIDYPQVNLFLVGEISGKTKLPPDIKHWNYLPREELVTKVLAKADVLVLVPPKAEGYGMVVLEAASIGIPAIVSSVYALTELVDNNKTGFVIKPGSTSQLIDKLEKLIKNPKLLKIMGQQAKKKFNNKFSIDKTNKKLLKTYL